MINYRHSDLSTQLGVHLDLGHRTLQSGGAADRSGVQYTRQARSETGGDRSSDRGILAAWCKVLNLPGNDASTYLDGMNTRAGRAYARLKSIGVPTP
jgi:hypothetical protein